MFGRKRRRGGDSQQELHAAPGTGRNQPSGHEDRAVWGEFLDPYNNTASVDSGDNTLIVDFTKIYDGITELFERYDMSGQPIGLVDIADDDTWLALLASGFCEDLCRHMAACVAAIVNRRYPVARDMPLDNRLDLVVASVGFTWSYPGEYLELAKTIVADQLREQPRSSYEITAQVGRPYPGTPLYKTLKSTFEVCIAVIDIAKSHPAYHDYDTEN
jgi:hypothetical protein